MSSAKLFINIHTCYTWSGFSAFIEIFIVIDLFFRLLGEWYNRPINWEWSMIEIIEYLNITLYMRKSLNVYIYSYIHTYLEILSWIYLMKEIQSYKVVWEGRQYKLNLLFTDRVIITIKKGCININLRVNTTRQVLIVMIMLLFQIIIDK